jgi:3-dehydroquinate synthase
MPAAAAAYDVVVEPGALLRLPALLADAAPAHHYALIADSTVAPLWGEKLRAQLEGAGLRVSLHTFPAGEGSKTRDVWAALTDELLARGIGRDGAVLALGGGVTGDLAGFVAATYLRGIPLVQLPTSLLAMVDSSVGGKTGIDVPAGKNLVGAFHPPRLVVADTETLGTLPEAELRAGLAEAVKHGAIADRSYLEWIEGAAPRLLAGDAEALAAVVRRSVEIKGEVVAADPFEGGVRAALNFGHTVGHAVEALTHYQTPHGYAVAIGMVAEARLGEAVGVTEDGTAERLLAALRALALPTAIPGGIAPEEIVVAARRDKKARRAVTRYALLERIGRVARTAGGEWTFPVEEERAVAALEEATSRAPRGIS